MLPETKQQPVLQASISYIAVRTALVKTFLLSAVAFVPLLPLLLCCRVSYCSYSLERCSWVVCSTVHFRDSKNKKGKEQWKPIQTEQSSYVAPFCTPAVRSYYTFYLSMYLCWLSKKNYSNKRLFLMHLSFSFTYPNTCSVKKKITSSSSSWGFCHIS